MLKKSTFTKFPFALVVIAMMYLGSLSSCGGNSSESDKTADSTKTTNEQTTSTTSDNSKKYELKSGIVTYKPIEFMKGMSTKETLYFDEYGQKEAKVSVTETNIMGISNKETSVSINDGDYMITYSLEKIENGKNVTEKVAKKSKLTEDMKAMINMASMFTDTKKLTEQFDYKEEGTETVAGLTGKKFSLKLDKGKSDRVFVVTYKNILLKTEMMKIKIEAEKFEENASVPADKFVVPAGYKVEEVDMSKSMPGM